jgi:hypothetical protein
MSAGDGGRVSIAAEGKMLLPLVSAGHEGGDIAVYEYCFESKSVPRDEYHHRALGTDIYSFKSDHFGRKKNEVSGIMHDVVGSFFSDELSMR